MIFTQISNNSTTKPHRSSCGHALKYHGWEMPQIYFCYNKSLLQQTCVCCGKSILVVTKLLSRLFFSPHVLAVCHDQKILSRQLPQKKCCQGMHTCQNKWHVSSWQKICFVMTNPCLLQQTFVMTKIMHDTCGSSHQWYSSGMHRSNSTEDWHSERFEWFHKTRKRNKQVSWRLENIIYLPWTEAPVITSIMFMILSL